MNKSTSKRQFISKVRKHLNGLFDKAKIKIQYKKNNEGTYETLIRVIQKNKTFMSKKVDSNFFRSMGMAHAAIKNQAGRSRPRRGEYYAKMTA